LSDAVQIATLITGVAGTLGLAYIGYLQNRAAKATVEVKDTLATNETNTTKKLDTIHVLVNSKLGAVLRSLAIALRQNAIDRPTPENLKAAEDAENDTREHDAKQAAVDAQHGAST
jgi:hypothetical protein